MRGIKIPTRVGSNGLLTQVVSTLKGNFRNGVATMTAYLSRKIRRKYHGTNRN